MKYKQTTDFPSFLERKLQEGIAVREGMEMWKKQREIAHQNKLREQREVRQMLENYWPWSMQNERPRGFNNMYDTGIYPQEDFKKAEKYSGTLGVRKPGGGAPLISNSGKKIVRTREDPILRFQWSNDLRRTVDNTLRYKVSKQQQDEYRRQLDKLVREKQLQRERERKEAMEYERKLFAQTPPWGKPGPGGVLWRHPKDIGFQFLKSMGWSDEKELKTLEKEADKKLKRNNNLEKLKPLELKDSSSEQCKCKHPKEEKEASNENMKRQKTLSPLSKDGKGKGDNHYTDLVPIIAEKRGELKIPLGTTDVTRGIPDYSFAKHRHHNSAYLRELSQQMKYRNQMNKEQKVKDNEQFRNHFQTWENFWGRPGNGAPRSVIKKGCLDKMLYPQFVPIAVH